MKRNYMTSILLGAALTALAFSASAEMEASMEKSADTAANPCATAAANPCANPCATAAANPCANPCATAEANPCAGASTQMVETLRNPCAQKNPCAAQEAETQVSSDETDM